MQGYIGLVRYSCGTVHSFNLDKGLKSLCGNKFGIHEKITWDDPSEVTCTSCQEILYEKYETDFNLNEQHYSLEHSAEDDTNYNIPYFEDSIPEADDSYDPQLTAQEENVPSMTAESIDITATTETSSIISSDFEEGNTESRVELQTRNESNNNISIVEDGTLEVDDSYTFQSTTVEEMHREILEEVASSVDTDSVNTTVTNEPSNNDSSDLEKDNLEADSEDNSEDNSNNTDDNAVNLDDLDDININEEAEEPVIILI